VVSICSVLLDPMIAPSNFGHLNHLLCRQIKLADTCMMHEMARTDDKRIVVLSLVRLLLSNISFVAFWLTYSSARMCSCRVSVALLCH
jgi:hypothetical protein